MNSFFLLPAYTLAGSLLASRARTLSFCRAASRVRLALLALLASTRLTCLAVYPAFPIVLGEPLF